MPYTLLRGSNQISWPLGIPEQFNLRLTLDDPCMTIDPSNALHFSQGPFYQIW